jgi:hypothetical protein
MKGGFQPRFTLCWDKIGNLIAGEQQVQNRWAQYSEELSSSRLQHNLRMLKLSTLTLNHIYLCPYMPMITEVYDTIRRMEDNRAPGEDLVKDIQ